MFYDRFSKLCNQAGVTPAKVAESIGVNKSTMYMWKKQGTTPKYPTLQKLSEYFKVSVDYLIDLPPGERIKIAREKRGLTIDELSDRAQISAESLTLYEAGARRPRIERLIRIADALCVPITELIDLETAGEYEKHIAKNKIKQIGFDIDSIGIGKCIRKYRKTAGLTQEDLAEKVGISTMSVRRYERGEPIESRELTQAIAVALDVDPEQLMSFDMANKPLMDSLNADYRITMLLDQMTTEGKIKVADYAEDILPRYRSQRATQSPQMPTEGTDTTDTTPPENAPETPPEGEKWGPEL